MENAVVLYAWDYTSLRNLLARQFEGQNSKGVAKTSLQNNVSMLRCFFASGLIALDTLCQDAERILVKPDEMQPVEFSETSPGALQDFSGVLRDFSATSPRILRRTQG
ncbi:hypothetical protein Pst134EA_031750 [Puccinia striiformis f. sp. tritici]|uniref:uncharacterized protein n=1 Tax=Puccinia striiformis f. sp. tritici TaxID=168172 RepID=UPI0020087617|nr:uncharacterized protein Pst134EA_031750 [Puccinia striiformis f. sp. tritici]KAH9442635.1 hypothetical protein Pst134EA_031750 [Puccinia striiformis f. sp. tritici]